MRLCLLKQVGIIFIMLMYKFGKLPRIDFNSEFFGIMANDIGKLLKISRNIPIIGLSVSFLGRLKLVLKSVAKTAPKNSEFVFTNT